ncbi:MAG: glycosyltransferase family 39 protein [Candidatus Jordarchaeaceae archaeon]
MLGRLRELDWTVKLIIIITGFRGVLAAVPVPLTWDEAVYVNLAREFYYFGIDIHYYLFQQILDFSRPALLTFMLYFSFLITTPNIIVAQYVTFFLSLPALYAVYLLGKELYSEKVGKFSALALTSGCLGFAFFLGILTEIPFTLFSTLFLLCVVRAQKNPKYYIPAGVALSLTFLSRPPGILLVLVGFAYIVLSKSIKKTIKSPWLYLGLLGAFLTLLPWLLWSKMVTGSYLGLYSIYSYIQNYWSRVLIQIIPPTTIDTILWYLETAVYAVVPLFVSAFLFPYFFVALKAELKSKSVQGLPLILWVAMYLVAYPLINPDARIMDYLRYNQTSIPALSILTGLGLAMMLTNEIQLRNGKSIVSRKGILKGGRNLAIILVILNLSVCLVGVYAVRSYPELSQPIPAYQYLKYTTLPWQIIVTNTYPMATQYTDRMCVWVPDLLGEVDALAKTGYVRGIFMSLFDYASPIILAHLETSPLYERELVLFYQGVPYMILYRVK